MLVPHVLELFHRSSGGCSLVQNSLNHILHLQPGSNASESQAIDFGEIRLGSDLALSGEEPLHGSVESPRIDQLWRLSRRQHCSLEIRRPVSALPISEAAPTFQKGSLWCSVHLDTFSCIQLNVEAID
jgi:hypothetical protein